MPSSIGSRLSANRAPFVEGGSYDPLVASQRASLRRRELPPKGMRTSTILDQFVELPVRRSEVRVAMAVVAGGLVDLDSHGPELGACMVEVVHEKADRRQRRIAHAARVGD